MSDELFSVMSNDFNRFIRLYGKAFRGTLHPVCELVAAFLSGDTLICFFHHLWHFPIKCCIDQGFYCDICVQRCNGSCSGCDSCRCYDFLCILFHTTTSFLLRDIFSAPIKTDAPPDSDHSQQIPEEAGEES